MTGMSDRSNGSAHGAQTVRLPELALIKDKGLAFAGLCLGLRSENRPAIRPEQHHPPLRRYHARGAMFRARRLHPF